MELDAQAQAALRATTRRLLDTVPPAHAQAIHDRMTWARMATEVGLQGVRIAEGNGGSGLGPAAEMIVHSELGRTVSSEPYLSTVGLVGAALSALDAVGFAQGAVLGEIAAGTLVAAAAVRRRARDVAPEVRGGRDALRVTGVIEPVLDASICDRLLVEGERDGQPALLWVDPHAAGVRISAMTTLDLTRRASTLTLDGAPATLVAEGPEARRALRALAVNGALAAAADSVGLAARALEITVEYVTMRTQFGRTIGSFQAVKHRCADMLVSLEGARSALQLAVGAVESGGSDAEVDAGVAVACIKCGPAAFWVANEALHLFGGVGYTWEHPIHLYLRRARSNQQLLDPDSRRRQDLARAVAAAYRGHSSLGVRLAG